jgi:hypothetical protein
MQHLTSVTAYPATSVKTHGVVMTLSRHGIFRPEMHKNNGLSVLSADSGWGRMRHRWFRFARTCAKTQ